MSGSETPRTAAEVEAELEALPALGLSDGDEDEGADDEDGDGDLAAAEAEAAAATAIAQSEQEAGRKGWVPKDRFKGDLATWVDAKTFLERGERFTANLQREIAALQKKVGEFEGTKAAFAKFYTEQLEKKNKELQAAISELRVRRSEAIQDGEHDTAVELEDRIDLLREQQKTLKADVPKKQEPDPKETKEGEAPAAAAKVVDPVILEWIDDDNKWFDDDPRLRAFAIATGDQLINNGETVRGRKLLDKISAIVKEEFPRKFRQQQEVPPAHHVEGGDNAPRGKRTGKTEKDLPQADRELMKQFIAAGWTTKEKFLKSYFNS